MAIQSGWTYSLRRQLSRSVSILVTVFGHVAVGYLTAHYRSTSRRVMLAVIGGAILPDIIDKPLMLAGIYPWGRTVGHSLFTWALVIGLLLLIDTLVRPIPYTKWVSLGVGSHFLADFTDDIVLGFQWGRYAMSSWPAWPLVNPDDWDWKVVPLGGYDPGMTTFELSLVLIAVFIAWRGARQREEHPRSLKGRFEA